MVIACGETSSDRVRESRRGTQRDRRRAVFSDDPLMASRTEHAVTAPFAGVVVSIPHAREDRVGAGSPLVVLEAMKMEHEVLAEIDGVVGALAVAVGEEVQEGQLLLMLEPGVGDRDGRAQAAAPATLSERKRR